MKKSFRGLIADGGQEQIRLSTNNGLTGYKVVKFELFPDTPGQNSVESTVQVFTAEQDTPSTTAVTVQFDDPTLIGAAFYAAASSADNSEKTVIVFDNMTFNQDIFVTHTNTSGSQPINYYIELEQMKLSKDEATVATLKDMRAGPSSI